MHKEAASRIVDELNKCLDEWSSDMERQERGRKVGERFAMGVQLSFGTVSTSVRKMIESINLNETTFEDIRQKVEALLEQWERLKGLEENGLVIQDSFARGHYKAYSEATVRVRAVLNNILEIENEKGSDSIENQCAVS